MLQNVVIQLINSGKRSFSPSPKKSEKKKCRNYFSYVNLRNVVLRSKSAVFASVCRNRPYWIEGNWEITKCFDLVNAFFRVPSCLRHFFCRQSDIEIFLPLCDFLRLNKQLLNFFSYLTFPSLTIVLQRQEFLPVLFLVHDFG